MPLKAGQEGHAIICNGSCGPIFGGGGGDGYDLHIPSTPNSNTCSTKLNNTYQCPTGQDATTFFTGSLNFTVSELEVFGFEK